MPSKCRFLYLTLALFIASWLVAATARAEPIETAAKQAIVVDYDTNTVLMDKNADQLMAPSSMSKLILIYMAFERIKEGSLKMTDQMTVSEAAWKKFYKTDASMMFLPIHAQVSVGDLLRGIIIQSGNDACSVLAEGMFGSEDAFAEAATKKGRELGLTNSTFKNASGWPEEGHLMTARDLSILATHLIRDFPEDYEIFKEKDFTYNGIKQGNRNPLLYANLGADGLKTGHTDDGGYGLTGTAVRDGHRIIMVLNGLPSLKSRAAESARVLEWAFREFQDVHLFKAGDNVADAQVWLGDAPSVPLSVTKDIVVTLPRASRKDLKIVAGFDAPLPAPIKKGQEVGALTVSAPGLPDVKLPLVTTADVGKIGMFGRMSKVMAHFLGHSGA